MELVTCIVLASCFVGLGLALPIAQNGTDSGLYNPAFFEGDIQLIASDGKTAVTNAQELWPLGVVAYKANDNVGCPSSPQCRILMQAIDHFHEHSCIRFKERTNEEDFVDIFLNPDTGACWSPVGRAGGKQRLSLGERCWYLGLVVHELGHAIGFWHEMNRPDRDDWIAVIWKNIITGFSSSFKKQGVDEVNLLGESFDYKSVMMYDELAFSKDGVSRTIQPRKNGVIIGPVWKKPGLSACDKRRLEKLYQCKSHRSIRGFPNDNRCNFNTNTCGFVNTGYPAWNWKKINATEGYVFSTPETSGSNPGYFTSINYPGLEAGDTRGPKGCVKFWYRLQGTSNLKLSQMYLSKVTQLDFESEKTYDLWESNEVTSKTQVLVPFYVTRPFKLIFHSHFENNRKDSLVALDNIEVLYTPCSATSVQSPVETTPKTTTTTTTSPKPTTTTSTTRKPITTTTTSNPTTTTAQKPATTTNQTPVPMTTTT